MGNTCTYRVIEKAKYRTRSGKKSKINELTKMPPAENNKQIIRWIRYLLNSMNY